MMFTHVYHNLVNNITSMWSRGPWWASKPFGALCGNSSIGCMFLPMSNCTESAAGPVTSVEYLARWNDTDNHGALDAEETDNRFVAESRWANKAEFEVTMMFYTMRLQFHMRKAAAWMAAPAAVFRGIANRRAAFMHIRCALRKRCGDAMEIPEVDARMRTGAQWCTVCNSPTTRVAARSAVPHTGELHHHGGSSVPGAASHRRAHRL
jgi:hypothetical protein